MKNTLPYILCSGSHYEIGFTHGKEGRAYIEKSIGCYKAMFRDYSAVEWDKACSFAMTFIPSIEKYDSDIMEEIRGIADGSGFGLSEILALNLRSEIVLESEQIDDILSGGCSALGLTPYITVDEKVWIGQDWDWKHEAGDALLLLEIHQKEKPDILMITEAGIVGKIGLNSCGVGVCLNALGSDDRVEGETLPLHIALRGVLNSYTLSDAIGRAGQTPLACCANFLMGSDSGQVVTVEIGHGMIDVIYADDGYAVHTNHFYGPRTVNINDTGRISFPDTFLRLGRLRDMIKHRLPKKFTLEDIKTMLRDHVGYPDSICRHPDPHDAPEKRIETLFSIIMDLKKRELHYTAGNPCENEYITVFLDK